MKHIQLFEHFRGNFPSTGFRPTDIVIGVMSEGTDVAVFPESVGIQIMNHLNAIGDEYYIPFQFKYLPGAKYFYVDYNKDIREAGAAEVLLSEEELKNLMSTKKITVYAKDGNHFGADEGENEGYALELVGGDDFMSAQTWGVGLESGAKNHFMDTSN